jgi:hypothetical protein
MQVYVINKLEEMLERSMLPRVEVVYFVNFYFTNFRCFLPYTFPVLHFIKW